MLKCASTCRGDYWGLRSCKGEILAKQACELRTILNILPRYICTDMKSCLTVVHESLNIRDGSTNNCPRGRFRVICAQRADAVATRVCRTLCPRRIIAMNWSAKDISKHQRKAEKGTGDNHFRFVQISGVWTISQDFDKMTVRMTPKKNQFKRN